MSVIMKGSEVVAAMKDELVREVEALAREGSSPSSASFVWAHGQMTWLTSAVP